MVLKMTRNLKCGHPKNKAKKIGETKKTPYGEATRFNCSQCDARYTKIVFGKDATWIQLT